MRTLLCVLTACAVSAVASAEAITVSAAISLKEAMEAVVKRYEAHSGDKVQLTFGSSGQLAAQIQNGAPVDVFISAAAKQMDDLSKQSLIDESTRTIVAGNSVALITRANSDLTIASFEDLRRDVVRRVAIGEPKSVPAGQYAMEVLTNLKLKEPLKDRLVFGGNVRQVLDYVERGEVEAGIVYASDAATASDKVKVIAAAPEGSHQPVIYPAAVVRASGKPEAARKFLDFLGTDDAQSALRTRGFAPPPAADKK